MDEMRAEFPNGALVPKTLIDAGLAARDARTAPTKAIFSTPPSRLIPNAIEVAQAQFESAWFQHDGQKFCVVVADVHRPSCPLRRTKTRRIAARPVTGPHATAERAGKLQKHVRCMTA